MQRGAAADFGSKPPGGRISKGRISAGYSWKFTLRMNGFEYIFMLFGLLLGQGLGGLARALKARHRVHIGWPTASVWREEA